MIDRTEEEITASWESVDFENPLVSIRCLAYNHEKYISKCLDGFLMQVTSFPFRIIVHDDASTDGTARIIQMYANAFPHIIHPIFEIENQYSKGDGSVKRIMDNASVGKYLAYCEGDDYWINEHKLQLQFDALENNPNCALCTCMVECCYEDGTQMEKVFPEAKYQLYGKTGVINQNDFVKMLCCGYPFHTSGYFIKSDVLLLSIKGLDYFKRDRGVMFRAAIKNDVYYIDMPLSVRRYGAYDSWNERMKRNGKQGQIKLYCQDYLMEVAFDDITKGKFRDVIFPHAISLLSSIMTTDKKKASELIDFYSNTIGKDSFELFYYKFLKSQDFIVKMKYTLFRKMPFLFSFISYIWHFGY